MSDPRVVDSVVSVDLPGGGTIIGDVLSVSPLMPWSGQWADPEGSSYSEVAASYQAHNDGKTKTLYRFVGIPYAEPPVGENRWKPATYMARPKVNPFLAKFWGRVPWQTESVLNGNYEDDYPSRPRTGIGNGHFEWTESYYTTFDENCLTLNIWTPDTDPETPLPVVVYIHGGGWVQNASCMYSIHGDFMTTKGVVYVTVEYRLSTFGMFYHPSFSGEAGIKGNLALTDQHAALTWISENIEAFGGDPSNVTLIGSSAGGASVLAHMETTAHTGLFHKAWVISGGGNGYRTRLTGASGSAEERGRSLAQWMRRDATSWSDSDRTIAEVESEDGIADALRLGPSPQHILSFSNARISHTKLGAGDSDTTAQIGSQNVYPFMDGTFLTFDRSAECFLASSEKDIPLVIGYSTNEASVIGTKYLSPAPFVEVDGVVTSEEAEGADCSYDVRSGLVSILDVDSTSALATAYASLDPGDADDWREIKRRGYRDVVYGHASRYIAASHLGLTANTWWYCWDYIPICFDREEDSERFSDPSVNDSGNLAGHTSDRNFWIGTIDWSCKIYPVLGEVAISIADIILSEWMMQRLANFAANGNPNTGHDNSAYDFDLFGWDGSEYPATTAWKAYGSSTKNALLIDNSADGNWYRLRNMNNHEASVYDYFDSNLKWGLA